MILNYPLGAVRSPFIVAGGSVWAWIGISVSAERKTFTLIAAQTYLDGVQDVSGVHTGETSLDGARLAETSLDGVRAAQARPC